jgi:hypothetical protein
LGSSPFHGGNFRIVIIGLDHAFCGVEFLEDEMSLILETMAPELEEMDEAERDRLMREIRAIYEEDDSVLKSFIFEPVEKYL